MFGLVLASLAVVGVSGSNSSSSYRAAVLEFAPTLYTVQAADDPPATVEAAARHRLANIAALEPFIRQAAAEGAQILVVPEYGIVGDGCTVAAANQSGASGGGAWIDRDDDGDSWTDWTRASVAPFCEAVPDVPNGTTTAVAPCDLDPDDGTAGAATRALSCLARELRLVLVADLLESDERGAQFNTAVAFDERGALLARCPSPRSRALPAARAPASDRLAPLAPSPLCRGADRGLAVAASRCVWPRPACSLPTLSRSRPGLAVTASRCVWPRSTATNNKQKQHRYRKRHLFGSEALYLDAGVLDGGDSFRTSFGVAFGLFICFDLLWMRAPDAALRHFAFPTDWVNDLAGLRVDKATLAQRAWSTAHGRTLLAANYGKTTF